MKISHWFFLLILVGLLGCYDEKEGCLDPNALNFDVSADKDCCCEYPSLKLNVSFMQNDTTSFSYQRFYTDEVGADVYQIKSFSFYLSHVEVKPEGGDWLDVVDSTEYWLYGVGGVARGDVSNNVLLVEHNRLKYDLGRISYPGPFTGVRFQLGLDETQKQVIPDSLSNHPLSIGADSMWVSSGVYLQQKWVVVTDTSADSYTVDTFRVVGNVGVDLDYTSAFILPRGKDYEVRLAINIPDWLKGVDWQANKETILEKLSSNSASALSLVQ